MLSGWRGNTTGTMIASQLVQCWHRWFGSIPKKLGSTGMSELIVQNCDYLYLVSLGVSFLMAIITFSLVEFGKIQTWFQLNTGDSESKKKVYYFDRLVVLCVLFFMLTVFLTPNNERFPSLSAFNFLYGVCVEGYWCVFLSVRRCCGNKYLENVLLFRKICSSRWRWLEIKCWETLLWRQHL